MSRMPAALLLLRVVPVLLEVVTFETPILVAESNVNEGKDDFDSEMEQCVVLFTLTYTLKINPPV